MLKYITSANQPLWKLWKANAHEEAHDRAELGAPVRGHLGGTEGRCGRLRLEGRSKARNTYVVFPSFCFKGHFFPNDELVDEIHCK